MGVGGTLTTVVQVDEEIGESGSNYILKTELTASLDGLIGFNGTRQGKEKYAINACLVAGL